MILEVLAVPCLEDNYAYLVIDAATKQAAVVDPSEAAPVLRELNARDLKLHSLWLTHHHWDHIGGVEELCAAHPGIEVWGSSYDLEHRRIPNQTRALQDQETFTFADRSGRVIAVPGHTLGAIAYFIDGNLFSGDTLFLGGCGRVFEGTMPMMAESLSKLRALPDATRIWCGHEYAERNLHFAAQVEPSNSEVQQELKRVSQLSAADQPSVPGTIAREKEVNPFFRFDQAQLMRGRDAVESFTALRKAKDHF